MVQARMTVDRDVLVLRARGSQQPRPADHSSANVGSAWNRWCVLDMSVVNGKDNRQFLGVEALILARRGACIELAGREGVLERDM